MTSIDFTGGVRKPVFEAVREARSPVAQWVVAGLLNSIPTPFVKLNSWVGGVSRVFPPVRLALGAGVPVQFPLDFRAMSTFVLRKTITETFLDRVQATPHHIGFRYKPSYPEEGGTIGAWRTVSFRDFERRVRETSYGLMALGLNPGDRAVILSNTRIEWSACDMAILGAGAVTVPIYASNTPEDVAYILNHCEARIAFLEDGRQLEKVLAQKAALPRLEKIIVFDPRALASVPNRQDILSLDALRELGRREEARDPQRFERQMRAPKPGDLLTICYTSGTTGLPKGAMITHDNLMSMLEDCAASVGNHILPGGETIVTFLPYSHIIGKAESMATYVFGWQACFAENIDKLPATLLEVRPTVMFTVPRIFEKAHGRVLAMVEQGPESKRRLFQWAVQTGRAYFQEIWAHRKPGRLLQLRYKLAYKLVLHKIAERLGGRLRFAICGGAPLPREIGEFFQIAGVTILEGYGLTETSAPVSLMLPDDVRFGTVGRPLPEVSLRIAEDGEILVKSRKVFKGYYKLPKETEEVLKEGWFSTGDIGHLDADGFLHITDRKKDLIITSGGKNVAPQKIEALAKSQKFINQFVVHGDRRNYLTALVTLDKDSVSQFARENQILFSEYSELTRNPKVIQLVQKAVDAVNAHLASFETIKKFTILPQEFTIEAGELTPSLKVKRKAINQKYAAELEAMYPAS
jgi:long-chain acyl-CoA synthetase